MIRFFVHKAVKDLTEVWLGVHCEKKHTIFVVGHGCNGLRVFRRTEISFGVLMIVQKLFIGNAVASFFLNILLGLKPLEASDMWLEGQEKMFWENFLFIQCSRKRRNLRHLCYKKHFPFKSSIFFYFISEFSHREIS